MKKILGKKKNDISHSSSYNMTVQLVQLTATQCGRRCVADCSNVKRLILFVWKFDIDFRVAGHFRTKGRMVKDLRLDLGELTDVDEDGSDDVGGCLWK